MQWQLTFDAMVGLFEAGRSVSESSFNLLFLCTLESVPNGWECVGGGVVDKSLLVFVYYCSLTKKSPPSLHSAFIGLKFTPNYEH